MTINFYGRIALYDGWTELTLNAHLRHHGISGSKLNKWDSISKISPKWGYFRPMLGEQGTCQLEMWGGQMVILPIHQSKIVKASCCSKLLILRQLPRWILWWLLAAGTASVFGRFEQWPILNIGKAYQCHDFLRLFGCPSLYISYFLNFYFKK